MSNEKKINQGGSAYPRSVFYSSGGPSMADNIPQEGMSYRQWLIGQFMQMALIANPSLADCCIVVGVKDIKDYNCNVHYPIYIAKRAIAHADAIIKELEEEKNERNSNNIAD